jgi:hypothetical protein
MGGETLRCKARRWHRLGVQVDEREDQGGTKGKALNLFLLSKISVYKKHATRIARGKCVLLSLPGMRCSCIRVLFACRSVA